MTTIIPDSSFNLAECRICFENISTIENPLISPCLCNGTSKYVHKGCLQRWRRENMTTIAFRRCQECHFYYHIKEGDIEETYVFSDEYIESFTKCKNISIFSCFIGLFILSTRTLDKYSGFPSLRIITNFKEPPREITNSFINDPIYHLEYNFCFVYFIFFLLFHLYFFIRTMKKIERKCLYWTQAILPFSLSLATTSHLYYFGLICNNNYQTIEGGLFIDLLASLFNFYIISFLLQIHNKIITRMNQNLIGDIYEIN